MGKDMNSIGHLAVSVAKSVLRIGACVWCLCASGGGAAAAFSSAVMPLAVGFLLAEMLGILEELVDDRK